MPVPTVSRTRHATLEVLFQDYRDGSVAAREEIARRHMPMARRLANRYRNSREGPDDLEQVAYLGLLKTIDRFDPAAGSFVAYAIMTIRGELKRHFRDRGWMLSLSRSLQEHALLVSAATERLTASSGHTPKVSELAGETGLSQGEVVAAMEAAGSYSPLSLDLPVSEDLDGAAISLVESLGAADPGYAAADTSQALAPIVAGLTRRERKILYLRFVEDRTQSDIAQRCGLSQMHVSRLLRSMLTRMLKAVNPEMLRRELATA